MINEDESIVRFFKDLFFFLLEWKLNNQKMEMNDE